MPTPRSVGLIVAALLIALAATTASASGRSGPRRAFIRPALARHTAVPTLTSPTEPGLTLGVSGAQDELTSGSTASISGWNAKAHAVGVQIVRLSVTWSAIAPATLPSGFDASDPLSPGYQWGAVDQQVVDLSHEGYTILLQVLGAPTWAEGPDMPASASPGSWEPNATDFGQFATALATRYDGHTPNPADPGSDLPRVSDWQAWNEPNLDEYLSPQWVSTGTSLLAESPTLYHRLQNAFYTSVKAVSSSNFVVGAGTAPYGDPPGGQRMQPVTFDRHLFCLNGRDRRSGACPGPTDMDAIDDHPYVSGLCCEGPTTHALLADDTSTADMYKIVDVLKGAERAGTIAPAGTKPVWATEIGWNTDPPNPNPTEASPPAVVGRWASQALYVLWAQGVSTVLWYELADSPESPEGWADSFTDGLYYIGGGAKPAAAAFRFPFLTNRTSTSSVEAWGRAPAAGILDIQKQSGTRWVSVGQLRVSTDQVFEVPLPLTGRGSFRAVVDHIDSPAWAQGAT